VVASGIRAASGAFSVLVNQLLNFLGANDAAKQHFRGWAHVTYALVAETEVTSPVEVGLGDDEVTYSLIATTEVTD
jgi:hypothetical protein